jgi:hypothetical protein
VPLRRPELMSRAGEKSRHYWLAPEAAGIAPGAAIPLAGDAALVPAALSLGLQPAAPTARTATAPADTIILRIGCISFSDGKCDRMNLSNARAVPRSTSSNSVLRGGPVRRCVSY